MTFSNEWNERYQENTHLSIFPWSDLVSLVMRNASSLKKSFRVLEIGCGAGANIPLFMHLEADYYAIEGSSHIVEKLKLQYPQLKGKILAGDFTQPLPFEGPFQLIIDRGALTHNATAAILSTIKRLYDLLDVNGKFIGVDWFSTEHSEYPKGLPEEDIYTRSHFTKGQFAKLGRVHFSDVQHLKDLFKIFHIEYLAHKIKKQLIPDQSFTLATWDLVATKI
ncbi:MAG: class I SAM-dependent methyltransferase [Deltaproteobacteria bacterium]|nr:class I SAM-dependent methyltransferase [Deltaproteobacteria bacterium]